MVVLIGTLAIERVKFSLTFLQSNSACERMIKRDIARTFPDHSFFKDKDGIGQGTLFNVIKVLYWLISDQEVFFMPHSLQFSFFCNELFCITIYLITLCNVVFKPLSTQISAHQIGVHNSELDVDCYMNDNAFCNQG